MRIQCIIKKVWATEAQEYRAKNEQKQTHIFSFFFCSVFFFFIKVFIAIVLFFTSSLKQWDDCWCSLWKLLHNLHFNLKTNCLNCVSFTQSIYLFLCNLLAFLTHSFLSMKFFHCKHFGAKLSWLSAFQMRKYFAAASFNYVYHNKFHFH